MLPKPFQRQHKSLEEGVSEALQAGPTYVLNKFDDVWAVDCFPLYHSSKACVHSGKGTRDLTKCVYLTTLDC